MVGAIGHATLIAGGQPGLDALIEEWTRDVRKTYHGSLISYIGHVHDKPGEIVIFALLPDEDAFHQYLQQLGEDPWAAKFLQHVEGGIDWEQIEVNQV
jgi:hypothetical protein